MPDCLLELELSKLGLGLAALKAAQARRKTRDRTMLDISLPSIRKFRWRKKRAKWPQGPVILRPYY
jgi:hypothetical protein